MSSLHSNVEPASVELNATVSFEPLSFVFGAFANGVSGGVVSPPAGGSGGGSTTTGGAWYS